MTLKRLHRIILDSLFIFLNVISLAVVPILGYYYPSLFILFFFLVLAAIGKPLIYLMICSIIAESRTILISYKVFYYAEVILLWIFIILTFISPSFVTFIVIYSLFSIVVEAILSIAFMGISALKTSHEELRALSREKKLEKREKVP